MILIWIIAVIVVAAIAFLLALRSMKDFKETPVTNVPHTLYYLKNSSKLDPNIISKIHQYLLQKNTICSFEKLIKGKEIVLVLYAPTEIKTNLPELELLELEDYLSPINAENGSQVNINRVSVNQTLGWAISAKNNPKKKLEAKPDFLKLLDLNDDQRFFWQIVCHPLKTHDKNAAEDSKLGQFQVTIRSLVVDTDPVKRVELAKKMDQEILESTGFIKEARQQTTQQIFEDFQKRTFVPKEVSRFTLCSDEIYTLVR